MRDSIKLFASPPIPFCHIRGIRASLVLHNVWTGREIAFPGKKEKGFLTPPHFCCHPAGRGKVREGRCILAAGERRPVGRFVPPTVKENKELPKRATKSRTICPKQNMFLSKFLFYSSSDMILVVVSLSPPSDLSRKKRGKMRKEGEKGGES